jgi:elongation factor G
MGLKDITTGDTICDEAHPILLEPIDFYEPVISLAIEAKTPADQEKLAVALNKLMEEDPTLRVKYDDETAQTVLSGMGELHLEIIADRLLREFNARVNVGKPRVVHRETIQKRIECEGLFERELGEKKHYGLVKLTLEPKERGSGIEIVRRVEDNVPIIPEELWLAMEEGIREGMPSGVLAGYPVIDIRIVIRGGIMKEGETTTLGCKIAALTAFREGCLKADPILLDPIMMVDIITPSDFMGEVIGDINARRGDIQAIDAKGAVSEIRAKVPLKAMFGYSTDLRSTTQGRAAFTMQFFAYDKIG